MKNTAIKINLGSGGRYMDGYINCDMLSSVKVDKVFNLDNIPYPFKSDYADEIYMDNVLEHLRDLVPVMEEIYRILKNNGRLRIYVPYGKSDWALQDPTHTHYFTERSMDYFCEGFSHNYYTKARYQLIKADLFCESRSFQAKIRNTIPFRNILKYFFFNMYDGIYFELKVKK